LNPEEGSQPRYTEKNRISKRPSQKTGMEIPIMAKIMLMESNQEYCFVADIIPKGIPIKIAINMERAASLRVTGKAVSISWETGLLVT
jgi:hypothetical protein